MCLNHIMDVTALIVMDVNSVGLYNSKKLHIFHDWRDIEIGRQIQ